MPFPRDDDAPESASPGDPLRAFLEAMSRDPLTAQGGTSAYATLDAAHRDAWALHIERVAKKGPSIGLGVLALLGIEADPVRRRRLLSAIAEPPFAVRRTYGDRDTWRLVRPLGCEYASVATVILGPDDVYAATYEPFAPFAWEAGFEGVPLALAVGTLAHAVVRWPEELRAALLPFVELFSATPRFSPEAAA